MKKKLFCIFGLILIVSAIAYFCHDHSVLPLDAENANYISFKIYPQNEPNYMVTNDDRVKEIVRAINELDVQETTDQVNRMSDSFYYFWIQISDKDIPVELDENTISINNERYQGTHRIYASFWIRRIVSDEWCYRLMKIISAFKGKIAWTSICR